MNHTTKNLRTWILPLLFAVVVITVLTGQGLRGIATMESGKYGLFFLILLYVNLFLVLLLGVLVVRNLHRLWLDRRQRRTGSRLRTRMALMFVALSLVPTLIVAILSVNFLNRGVDTWFSEQISLALANSLEVSKAYYRENQRVIRHDAESILRNRAITTALTLQDDEAASAALEAEREARGLDEITIFRLDGTRIASAGSLPIDPIPDLTPLTDGTFRSLLTTNDSGDRVRAFVLLGEDLFLSAGHWIDRQILSQMDTVESVYVHYHRMRASHGLLKANHTVTLALISLLLLLAAIWSGLHIADELTDPITELVVGTRKVAIGDLSVTLSVTGDDELAALMASFNAMTQKLNENRQELQSANALLEERSRYMAAIVGNISAGVVSVNRYDEITLMNQAAGMLLNRAAEPAMGQPYRAVLPPELLQVMPTLLQHGQNRAGNVSRNPGGATGSRPLDGEELSATSSKNPSVQIQIQGPEKPKTVLARLTYLEEYDGVGRGFILTFDDLTEVLIAQRTHAWSEVARRIAHEIKNPLTPIQLWAQRMRRKYLLPSAKERRDWRVLDEGTETIINQVEELRVLVNEFSTFARLPRPILKNEEIATTIGEALRLHAAELNKVSVSTQFCTEIRCCPHDRSQIKQVITNLISNSLAAMSEHGQETRLAIVTDLTPDGGWYRIQLADSGAGIPPADRDRVFEPYFTTKKKGTGLGLPIVKKIIEDHGGTIRITDSTWGGTQVEIKLPLQPVLLAG
ncbi:MAG: HAMP domain-containing protein [Magnetococcales bacterium]|nr:HAMP domain-containing protein [Magnetococcales bacterium]